MQRKISASGFWAIRKQDFAEINAASLDGRSVVIEQPNFEAMLPNYYVEYFAMQAKKLGTNEMPIVDVSGILCRGGGYYLGYEELVQVLKYNDNSGDVKAQIIKINSNGGKIDGLEAAIVGVASLKKPVIVYANQLNSAAYLFGVPATHIMLEKQLVTSCGSISPLLVLTDDSEAMQKAGIKQQVILADGGEDKWVDETIPLSEEQLKIYKGELNAIREWMISTVKKYRAGILKSDEVFSGISYNATDAIRLGLADSQGYLDDAIALAHKLAS